MNERMKGEDDMAKDNNTLQIISVLMEEANKSMKQKDYENAVMKFQQCLRLEKKLKNRAIILDKIGYCFLDLGWFEEAVKTYSEYLKIYPYENDGRFFLASAFASLKWIDEAIEELKTILISDPADVLARHDLALCYRDKGWLRESLEEMRMANACTAHYGNPDEKEIVKISLSHLEHEIEDGEDYGAKSIFLFLLLMITLQSGYPLSPPDTRGEEQVMGIYII